MNTLEKKPKAKGPIRTEAVIPFGIVAALTFVYFHFFFDSNLKSAMEYLGYQVVGAQVDIKNLETSFTKGTFRIQGLEITNSQNPSRNVLAIGDVRFQVLWDGLLRARFVVDEMAVEQIQIDTPRSSPGKVKPPEPPKPQKEGPSALEKEANKLKDKALDKTKSQYSNNVLGDLAALLSGTSSSEQLEKIEGTLASKAKLTEVQKFYDEKSKIWEQKLAALPKPKEIQDLGDRMGKVKTSNFKNPQELIDSLNQLKTLADEANNKYKNLDETQKSLSTDLKTLETGIKDINALVQSDIANLEKRFGIPKLDARSLAEGLLRPYIDPYMAKFGEYKAMADKYLPPNLMKKGKPDEVDVSMQPRPRAKGVSYEFGRPNSYPIFWIKKISISSKANPSLQIGDLSGLVTNVTSNQALIQKPTEMALNGDFPSMNLNGFSFKATFNNLKPQSLVSYDLGIRQYPIDGRKLVASEEASIEFTKATASLHSSGRLTGLTSLDMKLSQIMTDISYQVSAKNEVVDGILKGVFSSLPKLSIDVNAKGDLPDFALGIESNLGPELERGFQREVQKKIDEARTKIKAQIEEQVGREKQKLESEIAKAKTQVDGEIKKLQAQLDSKKKDAESKATQAQKDEENKAKKSLQKEGEKVVEDLKKKFGL